MKRIVFFILFLFLLSACTQTNNSGNNSANANEFKLSLKFNEKQALVHELTITNTANKETRIMKTMTIPLKFFQDYTNVQSVMLEAKVIDENKQEENICSKIPSPQKEGIFNIYFDGTIDTGSESKINFFFPRRNIKINDKWSFGGLDYVLEKKQEVKTDFGKFNALKITFKGTQNKRKVEGFVLFDYENNRFLRFLRKESVENTVYSLDTNLVKVIDNFNLLSIDKNCLLAEPA